MCEYELVFEFELPGIELLAADLDKPMAEAVVEDKSAEELLTARVASVVAALNDPPDQAGLTVRQSGLAAFDSACALVRELEERAVELRAQEAKRGAHLALAQVEMLGAAEEHERLQANLLADAAPILAAKHCRLMRLEQERLSERMCNVTLSDCVP
ncbi:hypothetical protein T492DRAFT_958625, partial [Pavlovales sp. CCMP2436]